MVLLPLASPSVLVLLVVLLLGDVLVLPTVLVVATNWVESTNLCGSADCLASSATGPVEVDVDVRRRSPPTIEIATAAGAGDATWLLCERATRMQQRGESTVPSSFEQNWLQTCNG